MSFEGHEYGVSHIFGLHSLVAAIAEEPGELVTEQLIRDRAVQSLELGAHVREGVDPFVPHPGSLDGCHDGAFYVSKMLTAHLGVPWMELAQPLAQPFGIGRDLVSFFTEEPRHGPQS